MQGVDKQLESEIKTQAQSQSYIVPSGCPVGERALLSSAWTAISERAFHLLYPVVLDEDWVDGSVKLHGVVITWACAGCTVGLGNDENDCPQRKCGLGGKQIKTSEVQPELDLEDNEFYDIRELAKRLNQALISDGCPVDPDDLWGTFDYQEALFDLPIPGACNLSFGTVGLFSSEADGYRTLQKTLEFIEGELEGYTKQLQAALWAVRVVKLQVNS